MWNIPPLIIKLLQYYTGEKPPIGLSTRDKRRMYADEFSEIEQTAIIQWLSDNKMMIITDIMKGRGSMAAEWMLVIQKAKNNSQWVLTPMNLCMNYFGYGEVDITPRGNIRIGRITMQRKGGDGGRKSAQMLQFKINPAELFLLKEN